MNHEKLKSKQTWLIAVTVMAAISVGSVVTGITSQSLQKTFAENNSTTNASAASSSSATTPATTFKTVTPNQSTNKEFWINTVHLDGNTNINAGVKCDTCPQNTPLHPPEQPPANSSIPMGGGFRIVEPNKVGAWDFRSFTFSPDQIVVNQGDKVTLHFVGVQGAHHMISLEGIDNFKLARGQIHTVSFVADKPGTISYICSLHPPNMVGQILVLPKAGT